MAGKAQLILLSDTLGAGAGAFKQGWRTIVGEGRVLSKFSANAEETFGKDVVKYLNGFKKGNRYNPLNQNNVFMTTWTTPALKSNSGQTVWPADRMLGIGVPVSAHGSMGLTLSCRDGEVTVENIQKAIKNLRSAANEAIKRGDID